MSHHTFETICSGCHHRRPGGGKFEQQKRSGKKAAKENPQRFPNLKP